MPQYMQSGTERYGALHHHHNSNGASFNDHMTVRIRAAQYNKPARARRSARSDKASRRLSIGSVIFVLLLVLLVTVLASYYISGYSIHNDDYQDKELISDSALDDELKSDLDFLRNVTRTDTFKVFGFGKGSIGHGRDSRYWDKGDRRRDDDYSKDVVEHTSNESTNAGHASVKVDSGSKKIPVNYPHKGSDRKGVGLYNEAGRNELKMYEAEYEASLKGAGWSGNDSGNENQQSSDKVFGVDSEPIDVDDDYNNNVQFHDTQVEEYNDSGQDKGNHSDGVKSQNQYRRESSDFKDFRKQHRNVAKEVKESSLKFQNSDNANQRQVSLVGDQSTKASPKKKVRRRKFSRSCEMKFLNSTAQLVEPLESRKFARFLLQYTEVEERPDGEAAWEPRFAGHQNLHEREESFLARDQKINCGFVKAAEGYPNTGFNLAEDDANYISRCHIAVISCIFGNSDRLRIPADKMITRLSRKNVCFVMFMDELTSQTLSSEGRIPDRIGFIGLWKIVVVKNLPYDDMRRVGKIPKLLPHRLFPSARYSIWLDSKLRLQRDPLLILEYFLWRKGYEYAISNHYDRHCVWEEVAQNKKLNKYNKTVIDQQFAFYQSDGLRRFDPSDPERLLPSNVPEGSFIVRAHTPMSNLFSCLWFNEVDRFTSRDQLSFAYTYQKLRRMNPGKMFYLNMFKDCERRSVAKLFRHRSVEKRDVR